MIQLNINFDGDISRLYVHPSTQLTETFNITDTNGLMYALHISSYGEEIVGVYDLTIQDLENGKYPQYAKTSNVTIRQVNFKNGEGRECLT